MPGRLPSEKDLDRALADAFLSKRDFASWFWSRTRFCQEEAECVFCRVDNPWSSVRLGRMDAGADLTDDLLMQCETDVLVVFATTSGRRLALHIENKIAGGSFTTFQPELYRARVAQWRGRPSLGNYEDATTVLVAPRAFYDVHRKRASIFESYVSHEEIAQHLNSFAPGFLLP